MKPTLERFRDIPHLKKEIICYLYNYLNTLPRNDNKWRKYDGEFVFDGETYDLTCECKRDSEHLTYRNMNIRRKTRELYLDTSLALQ